MGLKFSDRIPHLRVIRNREFFLAELVKDKVVLHGGCVDSGIFEERVEKNELLHNIITEKAKEVIGVDNNAEGIMKMKEWGYQNVYHADLENWSYPKSFDVIILGEIIEHIDNCGSFLKTIRRFCNEKTLVVFTTPNAYYFLFWLYTLFKRESIHPDHNYLFSFNSLRILLNKFGFKVVKNIILWEKISFTRVDDSFGQHMIKKIAASVLNLFSIIRFFMPQYGKSLIVIAKSKIKRED